MPQSKRRSSTSRISSLRFSTCGRAVALALMAGASNAALAQQVDDVTQLKKVEITGSAIKRIDAETALPVQVITREDIDKAGVTTAAELLTKVSANTGGLTDGGSIGTGGFHDQMGFNSANLRGIGTSSTLVLLNGRRMANFASPGDDSGVDLNNIPAAAIQRVEILLDGASAIYGTDAIGGVVNFITRKDFQGAEINAYAGKTSEGGAGKKTISLAGGIGDLNKDHYNVFGVVDYQKTESLNTNQRKFISDLKIPERLPYLLSTGTYPSNIRLSSDQRDYLISQGFAINGQPISSRLINLSIPNCNPPHTLYLPNGSGGVDACTYDFMRDLELYPESEKISVLSRGVLKLGGDHQLFGEISYSRAKTFYVGTTNRTNSAEMDVSLIPALAATGLAAALPDDRSIVLRPRLMDAGNRTSELTSTGYRILLGANGTFSDWDYDAAINHSVNTVTDRDMHGYVLFNETLQGIADGIINPFGPSSQAGKDLLNSLQVNDVVRQSRGTMDSIDAKASKALATLAGGDLSAAFGAELRREHTKFTPSALLVSDNIMGDDTPGDGQASDNARNVFGTYAEVLAPLTKSIEAQFAVRYDHYENIGGTVNPKLGIRFTPTKELLFRASAGTGFRAPSLSDLYRPTRGGSTSILADPVCMAENGNDLATCADQWTTVHYSNPNLKPEKSKQFSFGAVFEPTAQINMSADFWSIRKTDLISEIGDDVILANPAKYGNLIHRYNQDQGFADCPYDPTDSTICFIELHKQNRGKENTTGIDLVFDVHGLKTDFGKFGARLSGTYIMKSERQAEAGDVFYSNLGKFVTDSVVQRWRHRFTMDWEQGAASATIGNTFYAGYTDQNSAIDNVAGTVVPADRVKPYSTWDISGAYQVTKNFKLRAGAQNVFNVSPPFSNQAYFFISGYDPSYTDPRGRFMYVSASYAFK